VIRGLAEIHRRRRFGCRRWIAAVGRITASEAATGIADEPPRQIARKVTMTTETTITGKAVLVTGANRGIGKALLEEALSKGAKRVYAGTRQPLEHPDARVTPLVLDVTSAAQIQAAAETVESLDILVNNAGLALYDDLSDPAALEQSLAVNLFGTYRVTQAFLPLLTHSGGAIVNILSVVAFAPLPLIPAYSVSKAAAFSMTQSQRALLAGPGVRVHAVMTGPTDTDMNRGLDIPKASPQSVARAILDGVEKGEEEIFPDPVSQAMAESWRSGAAKALERENAAFVAAGPAVLGAV
jgi:NAD(P)-dependent dehydrogenase (short-subunit alcohol dehydrogenase family)